MFPQGAFDTDVNNYGASASILGMAINETSTSYSGSTSWNTNSSIMPYSSSVFFVRGGGRSSGSDAGIFAFNRFSGNVDSYYGFRCVLTAP